MKKFFAIIVLIIIGAFVFCGCENSVEVLAEKNSSTQEETTETAEETSETTDVTEENETETPDEKRTDKAKDFPAPVEPEKQKVDDTKTYTCEISIECSTILNNMGDLNPDKKSVVPQSGIILAKKTVTFYEGETVFGVLQRVCKENKIHMESSWTPVYNSAYIEGINNLYEFDCGSTSGWMYRVNGWYPNYGCSSYQLKQGDVIEWKYTCNLGADIGGGYAVGD